MGAKRCLPLLLLVFVGLVEAGPKVESWQTKHGAKVMFVHAPDLPMVDDGTGGDAVPGDSVFSATMPGTFVVPPAKAEEMYSPEVFGRSATGRARWA